MHLTLRATGPLPVEEVWERYADPSRWPEWGPYLRRAQLSTPRLSPGARGRVTGPLGVSAAVVILEVDEAARTWSWRVRSGPFLLRLDHGVRPTRGGATTWLTIRGAAPVVLAYAPPAQLAILALVRRRTG